MASTPTGEQRDTRRIWIAVIIAVIAFAVFLSILHWGLIPAVIGGFSVAVLWWFISKAIISSQQ